MRPVKKIVVSGDISRCQDNYGVYDASGPITNIHRIFHILRHSLRAGTDLPVEVFPRQLTDRYFEEVHRALDLPPPSSLAHWIKSYHAAPVPRFLDLLGGWFSDSLVIGCEFSPAMKQAFDLLEIAYIDIIVHPIRFLPQLLFGMSSNSAPIKGVLEKYAESSFTFYQEAAFQKARYIPNIACTVLPENSLFLFGQKEVDKVLVKPDGSVHSLLDHKDAIMQLVETHECAYFKPHPRGTAKEVMDFFLSLPGVTVLPHADLDRLSTYMILSHESISTVAGLNSSVLAEAHYFGKQLINYAPFEQDFFHDETVPYLKGAEASWPIQAPVFTAPAFWHELVGEVVHLSAKTPAIKGNPTLPNLRLIFRGGGGNSFDDAQSYTHCCKIAALEEKVKDLKATPTKAHSAYTPVPARHERIRDAFIHAGCGPKHKDGYYGCDIQALPNVAVVCNAWDMHKYFVNARKIYSRHMLEHLSFAMMERTLRSWFECLAFNGELELSVPDIDAYIKEWQQLEWTADAWREQHSHLHHMHAGFWGWQKDTSSRTGESDDTPPYWDVHKSGYNAKSLSFFLRAAGFSNIRHIAPTKIVASKLMRSGERQVAMRLEDIRSDHLGRYKYAAARLRPGMRVLDGACGIGYGSWLMATNVPDLRITAVDIDELAIAYGQEFYTSDAICYVCRDIGALALEELMDAVISFETLEHLTDAPAVLRRFYEVLKPGGLFICSSPNQHRAAFSPLLYPHHIRHYTPRELQALLEEAGFTVEELASQHSKKCEDVSCGTQGKYLIAVCRK